MTQRKFSMEHGHEIQVGNTIYMGANPEYQTFDIPGMGKQLVKVKKGVPFVKVRQVQ